MFTSEPPPGPTLGPLPGPALGPPHEPASASEHPLNFAQLAARYAALPPLNAHPQSRHTVSI